MDIGATLGEQTIVQATWLAWTLTMTALIAIPTAVLALQSSRSESALRAMCDAVASVPALALLAIAILAFDSGPSSARWFLVASAFPDIARGTMSGVRTIDPAQLEVARALGLPAGLRFRRVLAPLAAHAWLRGMRDAATTTVAATTLAALADVGGYGASILDGLRNADPQATVRGVVAAAAFALLVRAGFALLERVLIPDALRRPPP